jgi:hypothetical protein
MDCQLNCSSNSAEFQQDVIGKMPRRVTPSSMSTLRTLLQRKQSPGVSPSAHSLRRAIDKFAKRRIA